MRKVCQECLNPFELSDRGGRPTNLCLECREARDKRKKQDERDLIAESQKIRNQGVGRRTQAGRPFHLQD